MKVIISFAKLLFYSQLNENIMDTLFTKDAFNYHSEGRPGKIEVVPTKPHQPSAIFHWLIHRELRPLFRNQGKPRRCL